MLKNTNFWNGRNVLITGISGFIGSNLAKKLTSAGANVVGIERSKAKTSLLYFNEIDRKIRIESGNICDLQFMKSVFVDHNIQNCFHLAAQVEVGVAAKLPYLTWETNIRGTYTVLEAIRESGILVDSIIVASSDKSYGEYPENKMPYKEDYPLIPKFPYDVSKACSDMIAQSYTSDLYQFPLCVTRFSNIYGPGQLNFSALIPDCIRSALGYSDFIPRGDGSQKRDYIFVEDVCDLYMTMSGSLSLEKKHFGEIYNAGSNHPRSVKEVVEKVFTLMNQKPKLDEILKLMSKKQTKGEIKCQYMDSEKVGRDFDWQPSTSFEDGLSKTIEWFSKYLSWRNGARFED
ncbi:MAG: NAD-dependent epimerase/dehydratase family protein [Oligoflexales bacterium]